MATQLQMGRLPASILAAPLPAALHFLPVPLQGLQPTM
jgi:hypothetical protein